MDSEWINSTLAGGAGVLTGVLVGAFLLARYVAKKTVDELFKGWEGVRDEKLKFWGIAREPVLQKELAIYPACSALVRKAKVGAEDARKASDVFQIANSTLFATCSELTTKLPDYEIYLPRDLFHKLHGYKHVLQELVMIWDIATSSVKPGADAEAPPPVPAATKKRVEQLCDQIASLCEEITKELHKCMLALGGPLGPRDDD